MANASLGLRRERRVTLGRLAMLKIKVNGAPASLFARLRPDGGWDLRCFGPLVGEFRLRRGDALHRCSEEIGEWLPASEDMLAEGGRASGADRQLKHGHFAPPQFMDRKLDGLFSVASGPLPFRIFMGQHRNTSHNQFLLHLALVRSHGRFSVDKPMSLEKSPYLRGRVVAHKPKTLPECEYVKHSRVVNLPLPIETLPCHYIRRVNKRRCAGVVRVAA